MASVPVVRVADAQQGLDLQVIWTLAPYAVTQVANSNLLQLLMAETVGMHPVALIMAGLIWGLLLDMLVMERE